MAWWLPLTVLVVGGSLAALIALLVPRRARRAVAAGAHPIPPIVPIVHVGSIIVAVLAGAGALFAAGTALLSPAVSTRLPFRAFWPQTLPTVQIEQGPTATVVDGMIDQGTAVIEGLSAGTRALLAGELLAQGAVAAVVPITLAIVCAQLRRRQPFAPSVARWGRITAITVAVGGIAQQVLADVAGYRVAEEALRVTGWSVEESFHLEETGGLDGTGLPIPEFALDVQFAPIGLALAIWAITELIAAGARMQAENARLRADTDGLV